MSYEWEQPDDDRFAQEVRIVLASAEFSRELTTAVLWLNEHDLDIRCVRMKPYLLEERLRVDVQQIVPLPEAADYQVQVKEKAKKERESRDEGVDFTRFDVSIRGTVETALWERNAIWLVCTELCKGGTSPQRIAEIIHWRPTRVWYVVDAVVDAAGFVVLAVKASPKFDTRRWFCGDGELVQYEGKTYALSNQWGGDNWHKAMKLLQAAFPDFEIRYKATS